MPVVAHTQLPTFERLRNEGFEITEPVANSTARRLHIGVLNLMPDAALEATERQFIRLLAGAGSQTDIYVHVFTVPEMPRVGKAKMLVDTHYSSIEDIESHGLDGLILTGANPANPELTQEPYWPGMARVIEWARGNVSSILCSCLATHAVVRQYHGIERIKLPEKRWGVYSHRLIDTEHPLVRHGNTRFDAPHSHVYEVTSEQLTGVGIRVLAESEVAGVHLAVSPDLYQFVYFQGHPEYDFNSLFKEYKREVSRFADGTRDDYPPFPENYLRGAAAEAMTDFEQCLKAASVSARIALFREFPEAVATSALENSWADTGKAMFANWLRLVEQISPENPLEKLKPGLDADDPLGLR